MGTQLEKSDGLKYDASVPQDGYKATRLYAADVEEIELAFDAVREGVTDATHIIIAPGDYTLTETLDIDSENFLGVTVEGMGGECKLRGPAASEAMLVKFAAGELTGTFEMWFKNLIIKGDTDEDGIHIDNTDAGKKINIYMVGACGDASGTGKSLKTTHGDTSNAIRVYCSPGFNNDWGKQVYWAGGNNGDRFRAVGHVFEEGGIDTSDTATLMEITLSSCLLKHEGITGGNAAQRVNLIGCWTEASGIAAAADAGDVAGNQTGVISP